MRAETANRPPPRETAQTRPGRGPTEGPRRYLQIVPVALVLWALDAAGRFRGGTQAAGLVHATAIAAISRDLGGEATVAMNHWLTAHPLAAATAAGYYIVLHGLVTGTTGILLLRYRHPAFQLHRNALIMTSAIGLVVFWLYPVAPPRMLPGYRDITATAVPFFSDVLETQAANQFGSLPSLHVVWALWVVLASQALVRHPVLRAALAAYPALTVLDVLATANHYMLDVITAPAVVLLAYAIPGLCRARPRLCRLTRRRATPRRVKARAVRA